MWQAPYQGEGPLIPLPAAGAWEMVQGAGREAVWVQVQGEMLGEMMMPQAAPTRSVGVLYLSMGTPAEMLPQAAAWQ